MLVMGVTFVLGEFNFDVFRYPWSFKRLFAYSCLL